MPKNDKPTSLSTFSFLVLCCFLFSGVAGLIYQIVWLRLIDKVIGSAPFAVATVLSVFMGGLALGSWLAGKYIDRIASRRDLLSLYGLAELVIGVYGLLLPFLIFAAKPLYVLAYDSLFLHFWIYRIFTFLGCSLLLLIPTTLMGITLPVLCRFYVENLGHIGARTGRLYGINTIGAAAGAALCGFVLLAKFGVWGSIITAAGINIIVGVLCILLGRGKKPLVSEPAANNSDPGKPEMPVNYVEAPSDDRVAITLALWIFGISGFCAMAYEVFWTRLLGLTIGPTTYSFTLVVSTFIVGLALGNILFGWLADRVKDAFKLLVVTQACAACLALLVSQFLGNSQFFFSKLIYTFQGDFGTRVLVQSIILFFILIGPTIFLGATFPLVNKIYARSLPHIGRSIGTAYALNTIGAILGSFVAGFIFIPLVGKENGLRITAALQVLVSVPALIYMTYKTGKKIRAFTTGLVTVAVSLLLLISFPSWNHNALSRGWYYRFDSIKQYFGAVSWTEAIWKGPSKVAEHTKDTNVIFYGDGIGGFTTVEKSVNSIGTANYYLLNSGKADASSHSDRLTQALSAHIPLLFHPDPQKVMVLGLASGMTAGEALLYPVQQLDILEINDQVIKAAEFFAPYNNNCLTNPITRMIVQDGRNHLELTKETYDIIISEPSNPWMAGLANLFTLDYFQTVRERLNEDGIFIQWTNSYDMDWDAFSMIGRNFAEVFPNSLLIETITSDFLLVGFSGEKKLDLKVADRNMAYAAKSKNITIRNPRTIFDLIVTEGLTEFFGTGVLHTDNRPHLEFTTPKTIGISDGSIQKMIRDRSSFSKETEQVFELNDNIDGALDYLELYAAGSAPPFRMIDIKSTTQTQQKRYRDILENYCGNELVTDYNIFPDSDSIKACARLQVEKIRAHLELNPEDSSAYYRLSKGLRAMGNTSQGIEALQQAVTTLDTPFFEAYMELGKALASQGKYEEAIAQLSKALQIDPDSGETYNNLGNIYANMGKFDEAIYHFSKAFEVDPKHAKAYNNLGALYADLGDADEAIYYFSKAVDVAPGYAIAHNNLGRIYLTQRRFEDAIIHYLEAVKIAPKSADFQNDAGLVLGQQGRTSESINHFMEALRINPNHFMAHYNLSLALLNERRIEEAVGYLFKAIEIYPGDPEARKLLGITLGGLGRLEEAEEQFSEALRINPNSAEIHDNLGVTLLYLGKMEEAIGLFEKALEIDESYSLARDHLNAAMAELKKSKK